MKKLILLGVATIAMNIAQAQIRKGTILLGGGIAASTNKDKSSWANSGVTSDNKSSGFSIGPSVGIAIRDNLVAGLSLSGAHGTSTYSNNPQLKNNTTNYNVGFFLRRYLALGQKFYLFGDAGLFFDKSEQTVSEAASKNLKNRNRFTSIFFGVSPGLTYAVNKRFHLETAINNLVTLGYTHAKQESFFTTDTYVSKNDGVAFNVNASPTAPIRLTFRFVIGK